MPHPFSQAEAEEIASDFEDLIDSEFSLDGRIWLVDAIAITPAEDEQQSAAAHGYYSTGSIVPYSGDTCEVILLVSQADDAAQYRYMPIRSFTEAQGIDYNFPA